MRILFQPDPYAPPQGMWDHMSAALQQSVYRVSSMLIDILPGLLAFVLALAVMTALGMALSWALRRGLTTAKFDERLARTHAGGQTSVADWSPEHSPTALIARIAFWACVLLGLAIGISTLDAVAIFSVALLPYLSHLVGAVLLLFSGNLIARFLARTVLIGAVNSQLQYARFLSMGVKWLVLVLTAAMVLDHLRIGGAIVELAFGILFGGIVLTLALAIGLGSRDLVSRSLEHTASDSGERAAFLATQTQRDPSETLRHF
jgi:hypothetical protein